MSRFVFYKAVGYIYNHNKSGILTTLAETRHASGVVEDTNMIEGCIFRQCRHLLPCNRVEIYTHPVL